MTCRRAAQLLAPARAALVVAAVAGMTGLTACSAPPGQALVVGDTVVAEKDFDTALREINTHVTGAGQFTADSLISAFVAGVVADEALAEIGADPITPEDASEVLTYFAEQNNAALAEQGTAPLPTAEAFSPITLQAIHADAISYRMEMGDGDLDTGALTAAFQEGFAEVKVVVNPRFGSWDATTGGVTATSYPWLISGAAGGVIAG
ncbi:MAG: hypothetical protein LBK72_10490 [Bifidobacteriaceae bacterium]|nr:hypothetical protein [Bifidobacteriaceae bacterium]